MAQPPTDLNSTNRIKNGVWFKVNDIISIGPRVKVNFWHTDRESHTGQEQQQTMTSTITNHHHSTFFPFLSDLWPVINPCLYSPVSTPFSSPLNYYYNYFVFDVCARCWTHTHTWKERVSQQLLLISIWLSRTTSYRHPEKKKRKKIILSFFPFCQYCSRLV